MIEKRKTIQFIPSKFKIYFWDVDWEEVNKNQKKYEAFIVCRLADKGNCEVVSWLKQNYNVGEISKMILSSRNVSSKTRLFWFNYAQFFQSSHSRK